MSTLTCPLVSQSFPAGTTEESFVFHITGQLADGTPFTDSQSSTSATLSYTFSPGTFAVFVTKNGSSSLPSDLYTVSAPTTVTLSVPDPAQKATISG